MLVDSPPEQRAEIVSVPPSRRAARALGLHVSVALLVCVALFQAVSRNPLGSPDVLGLGGCA
ncbi:hypothetical protein [Streptomyces ziwulingensis]|uniref:Uncharacterized protein n=1 Tax=Streptomyces ziwulingensis TaxID=1045501 RepID=A0ABP9ALY8_9ACTN